jgi:hypothetical protein
MRVKLLMGKDEKAISIPYYRVLSHLVPFQKPGQPKQ